MELPAGKAQVQSVLPLSYGITWRSSGASRWEGTGAMCIGIATKAGANLSPHGWVGFPGGKVQVQSALTPLYWVKRSSLWGRYKWKTHCHLCIEWKVEFPVRKAEVQSALTLLYSVKRGVPYEEGRSAKRIATSVVWRVVPYEEGRSAKCIATSLVWKVEFPMRKVQVQAHCHLCCVEWSSLWGRQKCKVHWNYFVLQNVLLSKEHESGERWRGKDGLRDLCRRWFMSLLMLVLLIKRVEKIVAQVLLWLWLWLIQTWTNVFFFMQNLGFGKIFLFHFALNRGHKCSSWPMSSERHWVPTWKLCKPDLYRNESWGLGGHLGQSTEMPKRKQGSVEFLKAQVASG